MLPETIYRLIWEGCIDVLQADGVPGSVGGGSWTVEKGEGLTLKSGWPQGFCQGSHQPKLKQVLLSQGWN
jgi:hypothetical protein